MNLRPYQVKAKDEIRAKFIAGTKRVVLCSPTGSGKTVTFASIAADAAARGTTVVIVCDRIELLKQADEKVRAAGLYPSYITAGTRTVAASTYIATVETLARRSAITDKITRSGRLLLIVDECHKQSFDKILIDPRYSDAFVIGATATPIRSGKMRQLADLYSEIIQPVDIPELIQNEYLVPALTFGVPVDMSSVKITRGDYDPSQMFGMFDRPKLYSGVVEKWTKHAAGTRTLCYCINVKHSITTRDAFRQAGINAEHIDGTTPKHDRERIISDYKTGKIQVLTNCDILTTGFDDPATETVIINRATESLSLYLQMCGRGSRPSPGKDFFNVLDMAGNVFRLGFWDDKRRFSLVHKTKDKKGAAPVKECPKCFSLCHAAARTCKNAACGYVFPERPRQELNGDLVVMASSKKPISKMDLAELENYRIERGYKIGWIVRAILSRDDVSLSDYAKMKNYKTSWIERMNEIYL